MLLFAQDLSQTVHSLGQMDTLAVKLASVEGSRLAQETVATGSDKLYSVIQKRASEEVQGNQPEHLKFTALVNKVAMTLGKAPLTSEQNLKLASAVAVDVALSELLQAGDNSKYAEARTYGREYIMEILRGVL